VDARQHHWVWKVCQENISPQGSKAEAHKPAPASQLHNSHSLRYPNRLQISTFLLAPSLADNGYCLVVMLQGNGKQANGMMGHTCQQKGFCWCSYSAYLAKLREDGHIWKLNPCRPKGTTPFKFALTALAPYFPL